jgi:hypothetical protein
MIQSQSANEPNRFAESGPFRYENETMEYENNERAPVCVEGE